MKLCITAVAPLLLATAGAGEQSLAETLIEAGHWKQARAVVEARLREAPNDALATFLLSQIRAAFGERTSPLKLAERAVALDGRTARFHRQVAEAAGVMAQHANPVQQLWLARRFRNEIETTLALDPHDRQALRDLVEFYILAPGIAGGDLRKADDVAARLSKLDRAEGLLAGARIAAVRKNAALQEALLRQAAESQPPTYRALIAFANLCLSRSDWAGAEAIAKTAMRIEPGRIDAYAALAVVYAKRAQWPELDAILAASRENVPDDLAPYYRAAEQLAGGVHSERAERYARTYLTQEPEGNQPAAADGRELLKRIGPTMTSGSDTAGKTAMPPARRP